MELSAVAPNIARARNRGLDNCRTEAKPTTPHQTKKARIMSNHEAPWEKPQAMSIPKGGYFERVEGNYGPAFPQTPANYGFTIIAKVKPGREPAIRAHGDTIEKAIKADPNFLAPLKLHFLKWVLFDIGGETYFMYQGIFDTDFDKYTDDAVALFGKSGLTTTFENLEGFPDDWKTNPPAFIRFVRDHHWPSFLEIGEYPYVSSDEIKKALRIKQNFGEMLDQMQ